MIHVRLQNRILDNRTTARAFVPLFIWVFVLLGTLFTMFATSFYKLVPVMGFEFLCIIPVFIICRTKVNEAFKALDGVFYEADLEVRDRVLYYGEIPLTVKHNKKTGIISLIHEKITGKYMAKVRTFWAIVHEEDKQLFLELCEFYNVKKKP